MVIALLRRSLGASLRRPVPTAFTSSLPRAYSSAKNDVPTHSEDAVHGSKHDKSPETLVKETEDKHHSERKQDVADDHHHHETRPHHPGKSDIDHLDSPTTSEEAVHADRMPFENSPLGKNKK